MIITSRQNSLIKQFRKQGELIAIEGAKLTSEALEAGFSPKLALFTETAVEKHAQLFRRLSERVSDCSVITYDLAEYISDTRTPQGIFAMFERISNPPDFERVRRLIILDGVQDPGNVGAIIRSCEAFGFGGVVLSDDSVGGGSCPDVYGTKVIRASAGSSLRLPSFRGNLCVSIQKLKQDGFTIWGAALDDIAVSLKEAVFSEKTAIVIGNEGQGISERVLALCDYKLYIPINGAESLNASVAAGIICYFVNK